MVYAVGRKPHARFEGQRGPRFAAHRRKHGLEVHMGFFPQLRRHDADDPPVVLPTHGEEQMEPCAPQVDVHFVRHHVSRHFRVGNKKHVFVRRARKRNAV